MVWLVSHIWALLGIALLGGLFVGWAFRGLLLVGRLRRAEVERDVTVTELEHARQEIEGLYAAQRRQPAAADGEAAPVSPEDARRVTELETELAALKAEQERLRASAGSDQGMGAGAAIAATAGAVAGGAAVLTGRPDDDAAAEAVAGLDAEKLQWRNRYLESRVRVLEGQVHAHLTQGAPAEAGEGPAEPAPAAPSVIAPVAPATETAAAPVIDETELDKLRWQTRYLRQRLALFEAQAAAPATAEKAAEPRASGETIDEELARLRWRNRYLEGRLAYLEEAADAELEPALTDAAPEAAPKADETAPEAVAPSGPAPKMPSVPAEAAPEPDAPEVAEPDTGPTPELPADPAPSAEVADTLAAASDAAEPTGEPASEPEPAPVADPGAASEPEPAAPEPVQGTNPLTTGGFSGFGGGFGGFSPQPAQPGPEPEDTAAPETPADPVAPTPEPMGEATAEAGETGDADDDAVEKAVPGVDAVEPERLDKPRNGAPDDLTRIDGIGPRIRDILNGLGIWHFDQIAGWSEANEAWVDNELSFSGRVRQEAWVSQAKALLEGGEAASG